MRVPGGPQGVEPAQEPGALAGHDLRVAQGVGQEGHALVGGDERDGEVVRVGQAQGAELVRGPLQQAADHHAGLGVEGAVGAAARAGVKRVVLLSSQVNSTRPDAPSHARLRAFEAAVRGSGAEFTILRPGAFASNAFAWAESVRTARTVHAPFGDVPLPVVDPADIAAVAAAVLREDGHAGRTYELTGPEAVSPRRQAAVLSRALGEEVAFVELSREEAHAHMARFMPEEVIDGTLDLLGRPLPAERTVGPDVETVLGRPAGSFDAWVEANLPAFR